MKNRFALAASITTLGLSGPVFASTIQWSHVGDPGNIADNTGFGSVAYDYRIATFEFTNAAYATFLNAVDQAGTNPYGVYAAGMSTSNRGGIDFVSTNANGAKYVVKSNFGDKPVNHVSWFDAARVANWMQNGQGIGASTETGAYTLNGAVNGATPAKNANASFWVPSENEWYKAAYYKGGGTNAGYWEYATQSETAPAFVSASSTGVGSAGPVGNFANFASGADWNTMNGNVTSVGTNGGPSAYGAYDMGGNIREVVSLGVSTTAVWRGGAMTGNLASLAASTAGSSFTANNGTEFNGFRLAASVPEPGSTLPILSLFGLALTKSRRRKA
jgi:sulfatase modifying factor 1